jgi:hypothetical protein
MATSIATMLPTLRLFAEGCDDPVLTTLLRLAAIEFCDKSDYVRYLPADIPIAPNLHSYAVAPPDGESVVSSVIRAAYDGVPLPVRTRREVDLEMSGGYTDWTTLTADRPEMAMRVLAVDEAGYTLRLVPYTDTVNATGTITAATQADPVAITSAAHGRATGQRVYLASLAGMTELNGRSFLITVTGTDTFTLDDEDGTGHTAYTSGGTWSYNDGLLSVEAALKPSKTATTIPTEVYTDFEEALHSGARARLYAMPNKPWSNANQVKYERAMFEDAVRDARFKRKEGDADRSEGFVALPTAYVRRRRGGVPFRSERRFNTEF